MKKIRKYNQLICLTFLQLFLFSCTSNAYSIPSPEVETPLISGSNKIKIALLLDTSNSMDGLIEQAKSQLWKIVNVMATAKKNEENAQLEIALYEYGNDNLGSRIGFIRQVLPLSNDLDLLSEKLFSLSTNGGQEYCGEVIRAAEKQLEWNKETNELNLIFIAGNEPFNQGSVDYKKSCISAKNNGITVNTIFCGDANTGINSYWSAGANLTEGSYMNIDMNQKTVYVQTPYDKEIESLNDSLNTTYLTYGVSGNKFKENQLSQDLNSSKYGKANKVSRTISKSSHLYLNNSWDLVDAKKDTTFNIKKVKNLPKEMKSLSDSEKLIYIDKVAKKRTTFQTRIKTLNIQRTTYISTVQETNGVQSLDAAMIKAIKNQAVAKGFVFEEPKTYQKAYVDFDYFDKIAAEAKEHRKSRLIDFNTFKQYSGEKNTIILDTRSKRMYDRMHIKGAIHINFSDFTQGYLNEMIPNTTTRILIYCNNNFKQEPIFRIPMASKAYVPPLSLTKSSTPSTPINTMALNIPTYINLYGYNYKNVYELNELLSSSKIGLELEGTDVSIAK